MKLLELFRSDTNKFFAVGSACRTTKDGYVYNEDGKKIWVPSETRLSIEYFDLYKNKVIIYIDGRTRAEATYEYLIDCVVPINVDVSKTMSAVQIIQRVNHIVNNEALVKIICLVIIFCIGLLTGVVFH